MPVAFRHSFCEFYFRVLLKEAEMSLIFGRRYGLVGRNGIGKTTLIKMLSRYGNYTSDMKYLLLKKTVFLLV